ncbi:ABC transporter permease [Massilia agilis]|uniref:ABC transporter permease n=1 Tax=Massilia agilis TaxID=1811226 RepID=A0ABT2D5D7_9BURK|nr:ABC transporter permease [Massilia agilis]MCS0806489.1 ABC transporter permease [Massilia agilis]
MPRLSNIYRLGVKELWSLWRDPGLLLLIVYTFTAALYIAATAAPEGLHRAAIAIVDEDDSALSARIVTAFYPPQFAPPARITPAEVDAALDAGTYTFVLDIPPDFQRDVLAGRSPQVQLAVDATRMSQAFTGSGWIQQIVLGEVGEFLQRYRGSAASPVEVTVRQRFNQALDPTWFGSISELANNITMLSIILTGAALIREREHGTVEHLLVMPVTPTEIMLSKVWAMGLIVMVATLVSLTVVIKGALGVRIEGSLGLFLCCVALHLFATTSMGIFMATLARSMPQFGLLLMLTLIPLELLSGAITPRESMPDAVRYLMSLAPTTHFVSLSQAILFRGAGLAIAWPSMLALAAIGSVLFGLSLARFRKTIVQMV